MTDLERLLTGYGLLGVNALRSDVEQVSVTGKTADSIRFQVYTDSQGRLTLSFLGREYFKTIETGRGPRKSNSYGEFDIHLEEYLQARGFPTKTSKSGKKYFKIGEHWFSAKSLAWKINKEGDSVYKQGGRIVYSETLTKLVSEIKPAVTQNFKKYFISEILRK